MITFWIMERLLVKISITIVSVCKISISVLWKDAKPTLVTLDYELEVPGDFKNRELFCEERLNYFRLSYYPHRLESFKTVLSEAFGKDAKHDVYGDFKSIQNIKDPAFFIHVIQKN